MLAKRGKANPQLSITEIAAALTAAGYFPAFAMQNDYANAIIDYSASGVLTSTTTASSTAAGSILVYVANASTFAKSHGISIVGAGAAGIDHLTTIASVNTASNYIVLDVATVTTVSSGTIVYHDDTVAINSIINDTGARKVKKYLAVGDYIISSPVASTSPADQASEAILQMQLMGTRLYGPYYDCDIPSIYSEYFGTYDIPTAVIHVRNASKMGLHMGASTTACKGFEIRPHSTINRTGGQMIAVGCQAVGYTMYETSLANRTRDNVIQHVSMAGDLYDSVSVWRTWHLGIDDLVMLSFRRYGLHINRAAPYGGDRFSRIVGRTKEALSVESDTASGSMIYVQQSDWNKFTDCHSNACKYGFYQNLSTTSQGQQIVTGLIVDEVNSGGYGIYVSGSSVQSIGSSFLDGRIYNALGTGAAYFGANSRRNIMKNNQLIGTTTITDNGTGNLISDNPVN